MTMCPARPFLHNGQMCALRSGEGSFAGAAEVAGFTAAPDVPAAAAWAPGVISDAGTRGRVAGCVIEVLPATHTIPIQLMCNCPASTSQLVMQEVA